MSRIKINERVTSSAGLERPGEASPRTQHFLCHSDAAFTQGTCNERAHRQIFLSII